MPPGRFSPRSSCDSLPQWPAAHSADRVWTMGTSELVLCLRGLLLRLGCLGWRQTRGGGIGHELTEQRRRALVGHQPARQAALLEALREAVNQGLGRPRPISLPVAAQPGPIVLDRSTPILLRHRRCAAILAGVGRKHARQESRSEGLPGIGKHHRASMRERRTDHGMAARGVMDDKLDAVGAISNRECGWQERHFGSVGVSAVGDVLCQSETIPLLDCPGRFAQTPWQVSRAVPTDHRSNAFVPAGISNCVSRLKKGGVLCAHACT